MIRASTKLARTIINNGGRVYKREGGHAEVFDAQGHPIAYLMKSDLAKFEREGGIWSIQESPTAICQTCKMELPTTVFRNDRYRPRGISRECVRCADISSKRRSANRKQKKHSPLRWRANNAVYRAVKEGRLKRMPCEVCGNEKSHAHHHDYSKPLEVHWLCQAHHTEEHYGRPPLRTLLESL